MIKYLLMLHPVVGQIYTSSHKQTNCGVCVQISPPCGAIPQMEGGQWGRVYPTVLYPIWGYR